MTWLLNLGAFLVYAHLAEYATHRWLMHRSVPGLRGEFIAHAIEHHGHGRNDLNIDANPLVILTLGSPLLVGCVWLGTAWFAVVAIGCWMYAAFWTLLHRAHHDVGSHWLRAVPGYAIWRSHHLEHHRRPTRNFGTVFIWTDQLFGTQSE